MVAMTHLHGGNDAPAFRAISPFGLIPAMEDGQTTMFESAAILRHMARKHDALGWNDPQNQSWAEWAKHTLAEAFTVPIFWSRVRTAAADRDEAALQKAVTRFDGYLALLGDQMTGRPYVCGDHLTAAGNSVHDGGDYGLVLGNAQRW